MSSVCPISNILIKEVYSKYISILHECSSNTFWCLTDRLRLQLAAFSYRGWKTVCYTTTWQAAGLNLGSIYSRTVIYIHTANITSTSEITWKGYTRSLETVVIFALRSATIDVKSNQTQRTPPHLTIKRHRRYKAGSLLYATCKT
jgi:hypothetical protein